VAIVNALTPQLAYRREIDAREVLDPHTIVEASPGRFIPCDDRLVVQLDPLSKTTASGLVQLPDRIAEWTAYGTVIAVGPGARDRHGNRVPLDLVVGDRVVFDWRPSHEELAMAKYFGPRTILLKEDEIVGVIEDD